ncbi:MAG TPA: HEXXH motif-containing putative peptide modification protein [Candidatus Polarisedimenticolia bacterium]
MKALENPSSDIIGGVAPFLPPETARLLPPLAARNLRRARRATALLEPAALWERESLRALDATLSHLSSARRRGFLLHPGLRAWLCAAEEAISLRAARGDPMTLFDLIAEGAHLAEAVPGGRLDGGFHRRADALTARLTRRVFARLPSLLLGWTPQSLRFGPFPLDLAPDAEDARGAGELHLDTGRPVTLRLSRGARAELVDGGARFTGLSRNLTARPRERLGRSGIILARRLVPARSGRRPGAHVPGLSKRLARALDLLGLVWEEGHREVIAHTRVVVPLFEPATVSFSQPDRPGVSFIRIPGKSLVNLTDDLLHEAIHHKLHAFEELGPLVRDDGEPRYRSAWRGTVRPLRGILHATYTFSYRARLLERLSDAPASLRPPLRWIRKELEFERKALAGSLSDLDDARGRGLLTPAGVRLLGAMKRRQIRAH